MEESEPDDEIPSDEESGQMANPETDIQTL